MTRRLKRIAPLSLGKLAAVLYGIGGLIVAAAVLVASAAGLSLGGRDALPMGVAGLLGAVLVPVFYALLGFIAGLIAALLYNLVARWFGGIEFEVE